MSEREIVHGDVLVLGRGFAGLRAANAAAREGARVVLVEKGPRATPDIMGFNVAVEKRDSLEAYESDLRRSADSISDRVLEKILVAGARSEMDFLKSLGFAFDRRPDGEYDVLHTLGSTYPRLVHYKALTGIAASKLMDEDCRRLGVEFHKFVLVHDLLKSGGRIAGAVGVDTRTGEFRAFAAKAVVLATGGCGGIYEDTTYPRGMTGDGFAAAYRAGAELLDMEFIQFEPCAFVHPERIKGKVIPTTLLRMGAALRNGENREFLQDYGLDRGSVQKFSLSRAMLAEIGEGRATPHGGIYYDVSMMPRKLVVEDHAIFYEPALAAGVDLTKEPAEVKPAAHTSLGGVRIDGECATSLAGLFAAGEVAGGFYGANRLGGSAGIETLVFGRRAGANAAAHAKAVEEADGKEILERVTEEERRVSGLRSGAGDAGRAGPKADLDSMRERVRRIMSGNVGLVRSEGELKAAREEIALLAKGLPEAGIAGPRDLVAYLECRNMLDVSEMIIGSSLMRTESRGVFYRRDFPEKDDGAWIGNIVLRLAAGGMDRRFVPRKDGADPSADALSKER